MNGSASTVVQLAAARLVRRQAERQTQLSQAQARLADSVDSLGRSARESLEQLSARHRGAAEDIADAVARLEVVEGQLSLLGELVKAREAVQAAIRNVASQIAEMRAESPADQLARDEIGRMNERLRQVEAKPTAQAIRRTVYARMDRKLEAVERRIEALPEVPIVAATSQGLNGADGWSPQLRISLQGGRCVLELFDWIGGDGKKPAIGFVGPEGLVDDHRLGVDIRGAPGAGIFPSMETDLTEARVIELIALHGGGGGGNWDEVDW